MTWMCRRLIGPKSNWTSGLPLWFPSIPSAPGPHSIPTQESPQSFLLWISSFFSPFYTPIKVFFLLVITPKGFLKTLRRTVCWSNLSILLTKNIHTPTLRWNPNGRWSDHDRIMRGKEGRKRIKGGEWRRKEENIYWVPFSFKYSIMWAGLNACWSGI